MQMKLSRLKTEVRKYLKGIKATKTKKGRRHCRDSSLVSQVLSVTLKGVVRIFGTDSASDGATGLFKRRRKETEEVINIEEKR